MNKRLYKSLVIFAAILVVMPVFALALPALAQDLGINYVAPLNLSNSDPREAAIGVTALLMTFLGIVAVIIILYGGFVWITAAGNEDKVATAKKVIVAGVIGLILVLSAYIIVNFIVVNVAESLNAT